MKQIDSLGVYAFLEGEITTSTEWELSLKPSNKY